MSGHETPEPRDKSFLPVPAEIVAMRRLGVLAAVVGIVVAYIIWLAAVGTDHVVFDADGMALLAVAVAGGTAMVRGTQRVDVGTTTFAVTASAGAVNVLAYYGDGHDPIGTIIGVIVAAILLIGTFTWIKRRLQDEAQSELDRASTETVLQVGAAQPGSTPFPALIALPRTVDELEVVAKAVAKLLRDLRATADTQYKEATTQQERKRIKRARKRLRRA